MYLIKNAIKNLGRNKGRNILLLIVILAVITAATVSIVINQTAKAVIEDYKTRFGATAELVVDWDNMEKYMSDNSVFDENGAFITSTISAKQYMEFADSKYLKSCSINFKTYVALDGVKAIGQNDNYGGVSIQDGNMATTPISQYSANAKLVADANPTSMKEFQSGVRKITDGRLYENINECMISRDFAELNNLKVGDKFTVVEPTANETPEKTVQLTVSGIYADSTNVDEIGQNHAPSNRRNEILVSMDTMDATGFSTDMTETTASYELTSPAVIDDFEEEVRAKGLPELYKVSTNEGAYNKVVGPVQGLAKITNIFMWVVLIVGAAIILLVAAMAIRERKYEIAVLRAMGLKKLKVISMLLVEMVLITSIGLIIGLGIGTAVSQPVANTLLSQQVEIAKESENNNNGFAYVDSSTANAEALTEINVDPSPETILKICLIALAIAMLSTTMGAYYVTKYEPLKLLSERN